MTARDVGGFDEGIGAGGRQGKIEPEATTPAEAALDAELATEVFDEAAADGETEAGAGGAAGGLTYLGERFEDAFEIVVGDARAGA